MLQELSQRLGGIPVPALVALGLLALVQLALQVYALIDLARRARVAGGNKWLWAVIIVLGQLLGSVVYLVVGRKADQIVDVPNPAGATRKRAQRALDMLYDRDNPR